MGGGGLNAALIAEIVGAEGHVVSVDIDPEVIDRAAVLLAEVGHADRATVMVADAEHGVPGHGPFGAIIVTDLFSWKVRSIAKPLLVEYLYSNQLVFVLRGPHQRSGVRHRRGWGDSGYG